MSSTNAPFGFRPTRSAHSGTGSEVPMEQLDGAWASAYASTIGTGCPIKAVSDGTLALMAAADAAFYGVFAGCFYVDSTGRERTSAQWIASTAATQIRAFFWRNPFMEYFIQANGSLAATTMFDEADHVAGTVNALSGNSTDTLNSTTAGGTGTKGFRIVGLAGLADNAWADTYTVVRVVPNQAVGILPNTSAT